jgi:rfaE bifunctional protein nucleotidyltransferase chain/domain
MIAACAPSERGARRIVFTNGCFDLLHPGHVRLLEQARALGDLLVVGVNSDESVRRLKGADRPLVPELERAELLAALAAVDLVVIFREDTPESLVAELLPNVLVKGSDWGHGHIVGSADVERAGGVVISIPLEAGYSTSAILQKIRSVAPASPSAPAAQPSSGDAASGPRPR